MTPTQQFILDHRHDDVRQLAFLGDKHAEVDMPYALGQIAGWQTACHKLPTWAATDGIVYPPHLNMEQCSSEATARYKAEVLNEALSHDSHHRSFELVDLTGGFGVDFSFLSQAFGRATYVERDEHLCVLARHNFECLGLSHVTVVCSDGADYLRTLNVQSSVPNDRPSIVIFLDPARRDTHGRKVAGMADCSPDVLQLAPMLMATATTVMVKLSPMLDWHEAVRQLTAALQADTARGPVSFEVHIVSVRNECKELLLVLSHGEAPLRVVCVNDDQRYSYEPAEDVALSPAPVISAEELMADEAPRYLLVPNSSIMKAGCFDEIAHFFGLTSFGRSSHLFVAKQTVDGFPGKTFAISAISSMNKKALREHLRGITQANIATRNFPLSVAELRKRLKIRDGGNFYIFATTVARQHFLIISTPLP